MSDLYYKKLGSGYPLIILHGLYGSGSNWFSIAKELSGFCEVFLPDQRNHGDSPHYPTHTYPDLMEDLKDFMDQEGIDKAVILGHSMGGKTAMLMATHYPERVSRLIIADISPLPYNGGDFSRDHQGGHKRIMESLLALDLSQTGSLRDADEMLAADIPEQHLRQFLLKNLGKSKEGSYYWKINLHVLLDSLQSLADGIQMDKVPMEGFRQFPVLFLKGENSPYINTEDERAIRRIFPLAQLVTIRNAGHWLHAEQPRIVVQTVKKFLFDYS